MIVLAVVAFQAVTYTLPPVDLPPYVTEQPEVVWYPINGSTLADLRNEMAAHGPHDDEGAHAGMTRNWTYWRVHLGGGDASNPCSMRAVSVTVYDTVTLPLWTPPPHADSALVAEWGRFVTMLGRHEAGHRSIAIEYAGQIAQAIASLSSRASCPDMLAAANAQGQAILASSRTRQKQYDADTEHGLRRGTALENLDAPMRQGSLRLVLLVATILAIAPLIVWWLRTRTR